MHKKHYFVIVNYNSGTNLITCIESIICSHDIHPHIIVVDNASKDGSLESCKMHFPSIVYIYNTHNIGFASAANIGARFALERNATTVMFCNPDATLDPMCAHTLTKTISDKKADIVSPIIYTSTHHQLWFSGGIISFFKMRTLHTKNPCTKPFCTTDYITGCVMCISAPVFTKIGLFDERFFLYYEDADFSLRAKNAGFCLKIVQKAQAYHKEESEKNKEQKIYFLVLSGLLFFYKHTKNIYRIWFHIHFLLRRIKNYFDRKKNTPFANSVYKAYQDYVSQKK